MRRSFAKDTWKTHCARALLGAFVAVMLCMPAMGCAVEPPIPSDDGTSGIIGDIGFGGLWDDYTYDAASAWPSVAFSALLGAALAVCMGRSRVRAHDPQLRLVPPPPTAPPAWPFTWNGGEAWLGASIGTLLCVLLGAMPAFDANCAALVVIGATIAGGLGLTREVPSPVRA